MAIPEAQIIWNRFYDKQGHDDDPNIYAEWHLHTGD